MSILDTFVEKNLSWAKKAIAEGKLVSLSAALPKVKALIISCADMRADPAHVLGVAAGDAVVMRNIGGRFTPGLAEQLRLLGRIGEVEKQAPGAGNEFHVVVMHHTDCGFSRLVHDREMVAPYFGIAAGDVPAKAVDDPRKAVALDVAALGAAGLLAETWLLSGLVYDVSTGLVEIVVPPKPSRQVLAEHV